MHTGATVLRALAAALSESAHLQKGTTLTHTSARAIIAHGHFTARDASGCYLEQLAPLVASYNIHGINRDRNTPILNSSSQGLL